jgi:hypothetical protein
MEYARWYGRNLTLTGPRTMAANRMLATTAPNATSGVMTLCRRRDGSLIKTANGT